MSHPVAENAYEHLGDQVFSVPFRHLWSTNFSGEVTASAGTPNGLARFVGDQSNAMLRYFAGDRSIASQQPSSDLWPLVFYGPSGTGKTSLAMAIAADLSNDSAKQPIFLSAVDFDRRYRLASESNALDVFFDNLLSASAIVIDDLHQIANKPNAQRQLIRLLDTFDGKNQPFLITINAHPGDSESLHPRLASRLLAGLCLPVQPPGRLARIEIVSELARLKHILLSDDAVQMIVDRLNVTVPKLDHFFAQLKLAIRQDQSVGDLDLIDSTTLIRLFQNDPEDLDRMAKIVIKTVAAEYHLKVSDLRGNRRNQTTVLARGVAIYLLRSLLGISFQKMGTYFGNRDHSTIIHAHRKIEQWVLNAESVSDHAAVVRSVELLKQRLDELFASSNRFV